MARGREKAIDYYGDYQRVTNREQDISEAKVWNSRLRLAIQEADLKRQSRQFAFDTGSKLMPMIGGLLVLIFIIGPGFYGIVQVAGSLSWYVWVLIGVAVIYGLRNR